MGKIVGVIPIKLNNERLPGKNLMELGGKPLCRYLFETMEKTSCMDDIYVICSDEIICQYLTDCIKFLKRPVELDSGMVKSKQLLEWFVSLVDADVYALMHVTQPFITAETIEICVNAVVNGSHDSAFPAHSIKEFVWYDNRPVNYNLDNVVRTQELEPVYVETELFVFHKSILTEYGRRIGFNPYIYPVGWKESVSIDDREDFEMAQAVLKLKGE